MKASLAFALLLKPSSRVQTRIAIPEGYRLSQIIATLGKQTGNLKGYQQAAANPASLGLPAFAKGNPEGYLFPATYDIQPQTSPLAVLRSMVLRFDQEAASVSLPSAAARAQLTESDVITVASLIQAEGKRPQDLPKIARVIYNRLNQSPPMPLQLDTTVLYALHSSASDVTIPQTQVNSPYNTYLHAGLPPGPIDSPGDAAIQAALHPAAGNWTYFLTVDPKTGLTLFTNSFTQFQQFQAQLVEEPRDWVSARAMKAAVLGSPIAHSLSPALHRAAYRALGLDGWCYAAIECDEARLPGLLDECGPDWAGLSLTMPLKRAVLGLLDHAEPLALEVGAANTVVFAGGARHGYNTDVPGMISALTEAGLPGPESGPPPARVLILGAGATACSALAAVRGLGTRAGHRGRPRPAPGGRPARRRRQTGHGRGADPIRHA